MIPRADMHSIVNGSFCATLCKAYASYIVDYKVLIELKKFLRKFARQVKHSLLQIFRSIPNNKLKKLK